jgi:hypothetical protein
MGNPQFKITMIMETTKEPFNRQVEYLTRMDMAMILSDLIKRQKDIKKVTVIDFEKLEVRDEKKG